MISQVKYACYPSEHIPHNADSKKNPSTHVREENVVYMAHTINSSAAYLASREWGHPAEHDVKE